MWRYIQSLRWNAADIYFVSLSMSNLNPLQHTMNEILRDAKDCSVGTIVDLQRFDTIFLLAAPATTAACHCFAVFLSLDIDMSNQTKIISHLMEPYFGERGEGGKDDWYYKRYCGNQSFCLTDYCNSMQVKIFRMIEFTSHQITPEHFLFWWNEENREMQWIIVKISCLCEYCQTFHLSFYSCLLESNLFVLKLP